MVRAPALARGTHGDGRLTWRAPSRLTHRRRRAVGEGGGGGDAEEVATHDHAISMTQSHAGGELTDATVRW